MGLLHDSEPGQQRLQVVLAGQVVAQGLGRAFKRSLNPPLLPPCVLWCGAVFLGLTVMIWALSSADMVLGLGFPVNSLWKACMALAVTS